jgi:hypothetical protein
MNLLIWMQRLGVMANSCEVNKVSGARMEHEWVEHEPAPEWVLRCANCKSRVAVAPGLNRLYENSGG